MVSVAKQLKSTLSSCSVSPYFGVTDETFVIVFEHVHSISCSFRCYVKASKISVLLY